jgi:hypothetical protein
MLLAHKFKLHTWIIFLILLQNPVLAQYKNDYDLKSNTLFYSDSSFNKAKKNHTIILKDAKKVYINLRDIARNIELNIILSRISSLSVIGNNNVKINLCSSYSRHAIQATPISSIHVDNVGSANLSLANVKVCSLDVSCTHIKMIKLSNSVIQRHFTLSESQIDSSNFDHTYLPPLILIDRLHFNKYAALDLSKICNLENTPDDPALDLERVMKIRQTDLDLIKLVYDRFSFHVDSTQCPQHRIWLYQKILKHMEENKMTAQYDVYKQIYADLKDSINHKPFTNKVNRLWWNKGQNRTRVVYHCGYVLMLFYIFNLLHMNYLKDVYYPLTFHRFFSKRKREFRRGRSNYALAMLVFISSYFYGTLWYTIFVFFGLKLNIDDIKLGHILLLPYILLQYLIGLVFLAYIISFIIIR